MASCIAYLLMILAIVMCTGETFVIVHTLLMSVNGNMHLCHCMVQRKMWVFTARPGLWNTFFHLAARSLIKCTAKIQVNLFQLVTVFSGLVALRPVTIISVVLLSMHMLQWSWGHVICSTLHTNCLLVLWCSRRWGTFSRVWRTWSMHSMGLGFPEQRHWVSLNTFCWRTFFEIMLHYTTLYYCVTLCEPPHLAYFCDTFFLLCLPYF